MANLFEEFSANKSSFTRYVTDLYSRYRNEQLKPSTNPPVSSFFGELTFGLGDMRARLPSDAYSNLMQSLTNEKKLSKETAEAVATAVKEWAVSKGATHFCHWFQPLTGLAAEKHDAFISLQQSDLAETKVLERFSGSQLVQGEPDASSFPSGGMRSTFEARGYTAWDPASPLFIVEREMGKTLCIPTVFFGFNGEALDHKTPLLRSNQAISAAAVKFLKLIGDLDAKKIIPTLGPEQEYFLVDTHYVAKRPDLYMCGKTLLGAPAPKGQQLSDHYFGSIPDRVRNFMEDVERELFRLGVPVKTRHNEVAPSQFEMAPIFEDVTVATDHNTLAMETMKHIAKQHGLFCIFDEKPFAGLNGTGKHCNWSVRNDKNENLLEPGKTPHQNLRFLAMVAIVCHAVHKHSAALRASIASPGNDGRLGGHEAPPAIISVFLGSLLDKIFDSIIKGEIIKAAELGSINLGATHVPDINLDYTDRNRTSPFAFTGNKFEFRAVGGSANVAWPMTVLNTAVADSLVYATKRLEELLQKESNRDNAIVVLIRDLMNTSKDVLFSGNNYSAEWREEAIRRKLPIFDNTAAAIEVLANPAWTKFLIEQKVFSGAEIESRYNVMTEHYNSIVSIEVKTLHELVLQYVVPSLEAQLSRSNGVLKEARTEVLKKVLGPSVDKIEGILAKVLSELEVVSKLLATAESLESEKAKKEFLSKEVQPAAKNLRAAADHAEQLVGNDLWTLPKYREMLFANVYN
jgi:glutamine synthetase